MDASGYFLEFVLVLLFLFEHHFVLGHEFYYIVGEQSALSFQRLDVGYVLYRVLVFVVLEVYYLLGDLLQLEFVLLLNLSYFLVELLLTDCYHLLLVGVHLLGFPETLNELPSKNL